MDRINVITGPMKCGKTSLLINIFNQVRKQGNCCIMLKPKMDNRFSDCYVVDRNDNKILCDNIKKLYEIERYAFTNKYIFIDEFQFLGGDINIINQLVDKGKIFYISGLNLTSDREPFGLMSDILCLADNIKLLKANCDECGKEDEAIYTFCNINKKDKILVGDSEYKSVCAKCYNKLYKK